MLHYADGGEIEAKIAYSNWIEDKDPTWEWGRCDYRIKQKPKYIEGKYYKCWMNENYSPLLRRYSDGAFYDGPVQSVTETYKKIEPFEPEQKKYGLWVATDKNGKQYVYESKPERERADLVWRGGGYFSLENKLFPNQTWEDEPIEI